MSVNMNLIIFGPQGSGKGTYASRLQATLKIAHISTGDLFREIAKKQTEFGKKIAEIINKGQLVPDEIMIKILKDKIAEPECKNGFILDGYPRTLPQAKALDKIAKIDAIINLIVPERVIIERLSTRVICRNCGTIYNTRYLKPKVEGKCDKCGGELYQREDDKPKAIKERLKLYRKQTQPLKNYYKNKIPFANVQCNTVDIPPEVMINKILEELKKLSLND